MVKNIYKRYGIPTAHEVGRILEKEGLVEFRKGIYYQTTGNCYDIACRIAELFGYQPVTKEEIEKLLNNMEAARQGLEELHPRFSVRSPACFVIREPLDLWLIFKNEFHAAFEIWGKEYNYGPGTEDGFPIRMRIPLYKK